MSTVRGSGPKRGQESEASEEMHGQARDGNERAAESSEQQAQEQAPVSAGSVVWLRVRTWKDAPTPRCFDREIRYLASDHAIGQSTEVNNAML
ncbi:hypothetical protein TRAPUB_633 [Trametes pubescens]|uniref:Uncharacterized protein n=1 Tax=Trametes pubescens TaxID=154538 RepID=A0A1M2VLL7_TRAPU|nr:hypothetical protein TRAPUB_633 [Trametes pubescens]